MSASNLNENKDYHERIYEISKDLLCSFASSYPIEEFNKPSIRERASFVSVLVAKTLLNELGYQPQSSRPNPIQSTSSGSSKPDPNAATIHPHLMEELKKENKKKP